MKKQSHISPVASYYWQHVRSYPSLLLGSLISMPITVLVNAYLPSLILASVLSRLSSHNYQDHHIWASFGPSLVAYTALLLAGIALWRVVDFFIWRLELKIQRDIAQEVFTHMLAETADFHANNFGGSLVSQTNKLLGGYIRTADTTVFQTYPLLAGIVIVAIILTPRAPLFVLLLVIFSVLYVLLALLISRPVQKLAAKHAAFESKQTGLLADAITNVVTIKSFSHGAFERRRFAEATDKTADTLLAFAKLHKRQMNSFGVLNRTISGLALVMAVVSVMVFKANIGTVFLILSYTSNIVQQLFDFSNSGLRNYNRAFGDAADMVAILAKQPDIVDPPTPEKLTASQGNISFKNVTFTHDGANDALFENFNLDIKKGEKIGLVGHSGSGKTTFTRLLLRFSDIDGGEITIDGQNIARITQDDLHSKIAYVPQEPLLFHRTIAENIGYGALINDQKAIEKVAKLAHAHEFIRLLPKGYETLVGERGVKLSGGQRQRVAIARAMLKDAPILALDEATSALDSESEGLIQDALWKLMEGRTALVIAHRLSTIQKMDRIIVLDNGKISEAGSHKELLARNGTYAKLWAHQSGGFIDE